MYNVGDIIITLESGSPETIIVRVYQDVYDIEYLNGSSPYPSVSVNTISDAWIAKRVGNSLFKKFIKKVLF